MKRRFKAKKSRKLKIKYIIYLLIIYLSYQLGSFFMINLKLVSSNEDFIMNLLSNSNYHILYDKKNDNLFYKLGNMLTSVNMNQPLTIFNNNLVYETSGEEMVDIVYNDDYSNMDDLENITSYIKDPNPTVTANPRVYIYNSHPLENYSKNNLEVYNITPNVMMASYLLKEKLNKLGIPSIVEDGNLTEFMRINNWTHKDSYKASRIYMLDAINKHSSLDFFIDIHRDSIRKDPSTVTIDGKKYAKVLFVVGLEHGNKDKTLSLANAINNKIKAKYPSLSRGVITKGGAGVDGIYNQDVSPNMILLEVGGYENTIEEVLNTIEAMSIILKEHLS